MPERCGVCHFEAPVGGLAGKVTVFDVDPPLDVQACHVCAEWSRVLYGNTTPQFIMAAWALNRLRKDLHDLLGPVANAPGGAHPPGPG